MTYSVKVPQLTETMEEATIVKWLKAAGDKVEKKDILYQIETDKSTMDVESVDAGLPLQGPRCRRDSRSPWDRRSQSSQTRRESADPPRGRSHEHPRHVNLFPPGNSRHGLPVSR